MYVNISKPDKYIICVYHAYDITRTMKIKICLVKYFNSNNFSKRHSKKAHFLMVVHSQTENSYFCTQNISLTIKITFFNYYYLSFARKGDSAT